MLLNKNKARQLTSVSEIEIRMELYSSLILPNGNWNLSVLGAQSQSTFILVVEDRDVSNSDIVRREACSMGTSGKRQLPHLCSPPNTASKENPPFSALDKQERLIGRNKSKLSALEYLDE